MNSQINQSPYGDISLPFDGTVPTSGAALEALARRARYLRSAAILDATRAFASVLKAGLRSVAQGLHRHHVRRKAIAELSRLDSRLLADIGIRREQIPIVVDGLAKHARDVEAHAAADSRLPKLAITRARDCGPGINDDDCLPMAA